MKHVSEEQLILLYYDDADEEADADAQTHVARCERCRRELQLLEEQLGSIVAGEVPDPGADYGARTWAALQPRLGRLETRRWSMSWLAAAAVLLGATFLVGRWSARAPAAPDADVKSEAAIRERILLVALGDHLRESQFLLLEVANRPDGTKELERVRAEDLVRESRLYRQTASRVGDGAIVDVLDELERLLLDVAHGPVSDEAQEGLRNRIADRDMLFKLRVLETRVSEKTARRF